MAKKQSKKPESAAPVAPQPSSIFAASAAQPEAAATKPKQPWDWMSFKAHALIVAVIAFVCYINSVSNEYAHDDGIVIVKNEYVLEGFAGLKGIFTKDAYDSYYRQLNTINQLAGGRYRPLSIATFAIEQQFFGPIPEEKIDSFLKQSISYGIRGPAEKKLIQDMHIRHFFNVLWYMACVVCVLLFLRTIVLKDAPMVALLATVLFTVHPIHTEVVANVKSRDEIMSLIFICLTFLLAFRYEQDKKLLTLGGAMLCYFLALLSKEYAVTLLALIPLAFFLFRNHPIGKSLATSLPFVAVFGLYVFIRLKIAAGASENSGETVGIGQMLGAFGKTTANAEKEVLNNPYVFATPIEKIATEIATSLNYVKLLFVPHPLSADYSYDSIPYKDFSHPLVWLSIAFHAAIIGFIIFGLLQKQRKYNVAVFAAAFYIVHLFLVNNFIFNIGATMGERLIFHSSVGFCVVLALLIVKGAEKVTGQSKGWQMAAGITGVIALLFSGLTIARNPKWKNDRALFMEDIKVVPNSVLVNGNVAAAYITMSDYETNDSIKTGYLKKAIRLLDRAIKVHPTFVAGFLNQGIAYFKMGELDSAKMCLDNVKKNYPNYPTLGGLYTLLSDYYMKNGWNKYGKFGNYDGAIREFKHGLEIDSTNAELWYNLGGAYFSKHAYAEAVQAWNKTITINPNHVEARRGMVAAFGFMNKQQPQTPQQSANGTRQK